MLTAKWSYLLLEEHKARLPGGESLTRLLTSPWVLASHLTLESARFSVIWKSLEHRT